MPFALEQFGPVLNVRNEGGNPYLLIGGQAVYFWASRYAREEPSLEQRRPFVSADIDYQGNRADVVRIAAQLGSLPVFPPKVAMSALAGIVSFRIGNQPASIEIVRFVPGVKPGEAALLAVEHEFQGHTIRVLDPVSLLRGKANLALTVNQKQRRDVEHLRIMVLCVRAFPRETLRGVESGGLLPRGWLGAAERVLKLSESVTGRKAADKLGVDWRQVLPEDEIADSRQRSVVQFREKRLPHWRNKISRNA